MAETVVKTKKARRASPRREGERFRIALTKADAKLSFSVSPSATGYTLRGRNKTPQTGVQVAVENFSEAQVGDSFAFAKKRAVELAAAAAAKGWTEKKTHRSIEDLL